MRETSENVLMTDTTWCSWLYLLSRCEVLAADVALDLTVVSSSKSDSAQSDFELFSSKLGSVVELSFFGLRRCAHPCLHLSRQIHTCDVIGRDSHVEWLCCDAASSRASRFCGSRCVFARRKCQDLHFEHALGSHRPTQLPSPTAHRSSFARIVLTFAPHSRFVFARKMASFESCALGSICNNKASMA